MSKRTALLTLAGVIALVILLGWFVLRVRGVWPQGKATADRPLAILEEPVISGLDDEGRKVVEIRAQGGIVSRDRVYTLWGIHSVIWYRGEEGVVRASAGRGIYNENTKNAEISGGLRVSSQDGFSLETEELRWEYRPREIICPGELTVRHRDFNGRTDFAKYLVEEQRLICPNKVTGMIAGHITVSGERLVIDGKTREITLDKVAGTIDLSGLEKKKPEGHAASG